MHNKRLIPLTRMALTALLSFVALSFSVLTEPQMAQASAKKHKHKHKASHHVNMSLVPPPPPSVAIPTGMLLTVPPPSLLPVQFNPYQGVPTGSSTHRCAHCGFSDSTYLAPTGSVASSYFKPFPRRTFYNADSYATIQKSRVRKTRAEKQTRRIKRRKCIYAAQ